MILLGVWVLLVLASTLDKTRFPLPPDRALGHLHDGGGGVLAIGQALVAISGGVLDLSIPTR